MSLIRFPTCVCLPHCQDDHGSELDSSSTLSWRSSLTPSCSCTIQGSSSTIPTAPRHSLTDSVSLSVPVIRINSKQPSREPTPAKNKPPRPSLARRRSAPPTNESEAFITGGGDEDDRQLSRDKILEKIREKKEVIEKLRCQPWSMRRKRRTLRLAQKYLERHEAKVSKTHLWKEEAARQWKKFKRWLANVSIYLIPWETRIKRIESHFGSVVSSYFTFLRWIFWVNFVITLLMMFFIVLPELLADVASDIKGNAELQRRKMLKPEDKKTALYLQSVWDFEGYVRVSPLFYGFYAEREIGTIKYKLPLAFFLMYIVVLGYSFWAILRKMAANARMSKMAAGKQEQYTFSWKVYTGWDYSIGHSETAANTIASNANKLKETIVEYKSKQESQFQWLLLASRIVANALILAMVAGSTVAVWYVVERSRKMPKNANFMQKNEVPIVVSVITLFFPNFFELIGRLEKYHPRTALRIHLGRILLLYLLNFYTLMFALFLKMKEIEERTRTRNDSTSPAPTVTPGVPLFRLIREADSNYSSLLGPNIALLTTTLPPMLKLFQKHLQSYNRTVSSTTQATPGRHGYDFAFGSTSDRMAFIANSTLLQKLLTSDAWPPSHHSSRRSVDDAYADYDLGNTVTTQLPSGAIVGAKNYTAYFRENVSQHEIDNAPPTEFISLHPDQTVDPSMTYNVETSSLRSTSPTGGTAPTRRTPPTKAGTSDVFHGGKSEAQKDEDTGTSMINECWETFMGQEVCRLITMDMFMTFAAIMAIDFFRGLWVRYCNRWWFWNLEIYFPEYGEFKIAENVLHVINNQGMIWLGLFFSPLLPAINNIKLIILMYLRSWACITCNVPAQQVFRASRSNNFYLLLMLLMLFLCTLPVGYVIASQRPSDKCGPFGKKERFYEVVTHEIKNALPKDVYDALDHVASPGVVIPVIVLLILIIYFLVSLSRALKESNEDLKTQLQHERTEEKRKVYAMAGGKAEHNTIGPTMPETRRVPTAHLPLKELARREHWRDTLTVPGSVPISPDSEEDSSDEETHSPKTPTRHTPFGGGLGARPGVAGSTPFIPSLQCLPEESSEETGPSDTDRRKFKLDRCRSESQMRLPPPPLASPERDTLATPTPRGSAQTSPFRIGTIGPPDDEVTPRSPERETYFPVYEHMNRDESPSPPPDYNTILNEKQTAPHFTSQDLEKMLMAPAFTTPAPPPEAYHPPSPVATRSIPIASRTLPSPDVLIQISPPDASSGDEAMRKFAHERARRRLPDSPDRDTPLMHEGSPPRFVKVERPTDALKQRTPKVPVEICPEFAPWPTMPDVPKPTKSILKSPTLETPGSHLPRPKSPEPRVISSPRRPRFKIIQSPAGSSMSSPATSPERRAYIIRQQPVSDEDISVKASSLPAVTKPKGGMDKTNEELMTSSIPPEMTQSAPSPTTMLLKEEELSSESGLGESAKGTTVDTTTEDGLSSPEKRRKHSAPQEHFEALAESPLERRRRLTPFLHPDASSTATKTTETAHDSLPRRPPRRSRTKPEHVSKETTL